MKKALPTIHPELQNMARKMPKITYSNKNLWLIHALTRWMPTSKAPQDIHIENRWISNPDTRTKKTRVRIYTPRSVTASMPVLLWVHGGGYIMGSPEQDDVPCIQYVRELGITVVSVDYRYAPKYPFPAGLQDCYTALEWIVSHAEELCIDEKRIAIGGASAGGGLAASLIHLAYDRQDIRPMFQLLVYPMLDDRTALRLDVEDDQHVAWNQKSNRFGWESYLGMKWGDEHVPEYAVPARRHNLAGLPPAWIGVGTLDLFYDEDMAYVQRLQEYGVDCEVHTVPGAFHGFDVLDPQLPIVQGFRKSQIAALKKSLSL